MSARIILILAFVLIAGCGSSSSSGPPPVPSGFLYVDALGGPNAVLTDTYGFTVYSNGTLSLVPGSPAPAEDGGGGPIAVTRDSKLLYTTNIYILTAFQINVDGSLTTAPNPVFSSPDTPVGLVTHPTADFLYGSSRSGVLSAFAIDSATGALSQTSSVSFPNSAGYAMEIQTSAVITPDGRYLYQNGVYYLQGYEQFPDVVQIAGFSIDSATGALSPVPGNPVSPSIPTTSSPGPMAIDSTGKFLYASYQFAVLNVGEDGGVAVYSIDPASGALTSVPGSPFSVGGPPNSVAIDASGKFLIVGLSPRLGGGAANCLAVLSIDSGTGALNAVPGSPFGPVQLCGPVVADPSAPFVYAGTVSTTYRPSVSVLSIDQTTGALTPIGETAIPDNTKVGLSFMALTH